MAKVDSTIEVDVPVSTAYNQWTQFEEFPRFMEGVREVRQMDDTRLYWQAEIGGETKEWYAHIIRQEPDRVLAWESEGGVKNDGTVIFKSIDANRTEIELHMDYEPEGMKEQVGSMLGVVSRRVEGDLKRFKEFIETRGSETGGWRGEVRHGETEGRGETRMPGESESMRGETSRELRDDSAPGSGQPPI
jgi:uncharacterized membrane protein